MKTLFFALSALLFLIFSGCESNVAEQIDQQEERGKEVEMQAQMLDQTSITKSDFSEFMYYPDEHSFDEVDAYYRDNWSMQEGIQMNHNNHSIALWIIAKNYGLADQHAEVIQYYVNEMRQLDWLTTSLVPYFKEAVMALEPELGPATVDDILKEQRKKNEQGVAKYSEIDPSFVSAYRLINDQLKR